MQYALLIYGPAGRCADSQCVIDYTPEDQSGPLCADVYHASSTNRTPIELWDCSGIAIARRTSSGPEHPTARRRCRNRGGP
jgi:hypothetical protein